MTGWSTRRTACIGAVGLEATLASMGVVTRAGDEAQPRSKVASRIGPVSMHAAGRSCMTRHPSCMQRHA